MDIQRKRKRNNEPGRQFLRTPPARNFSAYVISQLSEEELADLFIEARYESRFTVVCPKCGLIARHSYNVEKQRFRCKSAKLCGADFSLTAGTALEHHRLPLRKIAFAIAAMESGAKSISALQLVRLTGMNPNTATMLIGRMRELIERAADKTPLDGNVQVDGCFFLNRIRGPNRKIPVTRWQIEERIVSQQKPAKDRKPSYQDAQVLDNQRVGVVMRQTYPPGSGRYKIGGQRTIVAVVKAENGALIEPIAMNYIAPTARLMTDQGGAFRNFGTMFQEHRAVNHQKCYVAPDGTNNNQAESFFARVRRGEYGVVHHVHKNWLRPFLWEMAWREDNRRVDQKTRFMALVAALLRNGRSRWWRKAYQSLCDRTDLELI